ncbi:Uncharacterised protein [Bordetella pertussis]|nr:Uncharacterised protein [Bordetella pertussis]
MSAMMPTGCRTSNASAAATSTVTAMAGSA